MPAENRQAFFMIYCRDTPGHVYTLYFQCFSDKYRSASMAALHPEPAAVTACL